MSLTPEQRKKIEELLAAGQITEAEAERLLAEPEPEPPAAELPDSSAEAPAVEPDSAAGTAATPVSEPAPAAADKAAPDSPSAQKNEQRFDTDKSPTVIITAAAALNLISWLPNAVQIKGEQFQAQMSENEVTITAAADVTVMVPTAARVTVLEANGRLDIKHIDGRIHITEAQELCSLKNVQQVEIEKAALDVLGNSINGDLMIGEIGRNLTLRDVANLQVGLVGGKISANYVNGVVDLSEVQGDVDLHTVTGDLAIGHAYSNVTLSNLGGQATVSAVAGSIHLAGGLVSGEHSFQAQNDILVRWPVSAPLNLVATAAKVVNHLPLLNTSEVTEDSITTFSGVLEDGKTLLVLKTPQRIGLKPLYLGEKARFDNFDFSAEAVQTAPLGGTAFQEADASSAPTLSEVVATAVTDGLADIWPQLEQEIGAEAAARLGASGLEEQMMAAIASYLRRALGSNTVTETKPIARPGIDAFRRAEQAVEHSLLQARQTAAHTWQRIQNTAARPAPAAVTAQTATATRQILELLNDGRLSVEEADTLLQALMSK